MSIVTTAAAPTVNVITDPASGDVLTAPVGTYLQLRFTRKGIVLSQWRLVDRPGHLLPIDESDHAFTFLVFGDEAPQPLRLARVRTDRSEPSEERELFVIPVQQLVPAQRSA